MPLYEALLSSQLAKQAANAPEAQRILQSIFDQSACRSEGHDTVRGYYHGSLLLIIASDANTPNELLVRYPGALHSAKPVAAVDLS